MVTKKKQVQHHAMTHGAGPVSSSYFQILRWRLNFMIPFLHVSSSTQIVLPILQVSTIIGGNLGLPAREYFLRATSLRLAV